MMRNFDPWPFAPSSTIAEMYTILCPSDFATALLVTLEFTMENVGEMTEMETMQYIQQMQQQLRAFWIKQQHEVESINSMKLTL